MIVFDQEIYNQFRYRTPRPYFHTFEAEDGQVVDCDSEVPVLEEWIGEANGQQEGEVVVVLFMLACEEELLLSIGKELLQ